MNKLIVLMLLLVATPVWSFDFFSSSLSCKQADKTSKPEWVHQGLNYSQSGYIYGFAQVMKQKNETYQAQLSRAKNDARMSLSTSLLVEVEGSVEINADKTVSKGNSHVTQTMVKRSKSYTKLTLPNLKIRAKWQDKKSCDLFVLVELSARTANLVVKKSLAYSFYQKATDQKYTVPKRLHLINNAIALANDWPFGELANSQSSAAMLIGYHVLKEDLIRLLASRNNILLFIGNNSVSDMAKNITHVISAQARGTFKGGDCSSSTMCLVEAQRSPANFATIVTTSMDVIKERGFYVGAFSFDVTIWDLSNNQLLYNSQNMPNIKAINVMNRQKSKVSLARAYKKWHKANPMILNKLSLYYVLNDNNK